MNLRKQKLNYRDIKIIANYAQKVVEKNKKQLVWNDWKEIGREIPGTDDKLKPVIAKRVIMSNLELANSKIMDLLIQSDIKPERALNIYKEAEEIARNKENSGDLIKIADRYVELHDLKPQKVQISETRKEIDYTNMLPNEVKKTISTTKNLENGKFSRVNTNQDSENGLNNNTNDK